jgi:hypothetical protein
MTKTSNAERYELTLKVVEVMRVADPAAAIDVLVTVIAGLLAAGRHLSAAEVDRWAVKIGSEIAKTAHRYRKAEADGLLTAITEKLQ